MQDRAQKGTVWLAGALTLLAAAQVRAQPLLPDTPEQTVADSLRRSIASRLRSSEDVVPPADRPDRLTSLSFSNRHIRVEWTLQEYDVPGYVVLRGRERDELWARRIAWRAQTDVVHILESVGRDFRKIYDFDLGFDSIDLVASRRGAVVIRARYGREAANSVCLTAEKDCHVDRTGVFELAEWKSLQPPFDTSTKDRTGGRSGYGLEKR